MNEVKSPKKPLVYYYAIVILVILALNFLAVPWLSQRQVKEVDYGTFMTMTENQEIGRVEVQNNQILFTNKDDTQVYKTGLMDDPDLIYRLKDSGAEFSSEIVEQMSPFLSFLLTWLLPIVFFVALGQFMLKRMTNKAGGPNSMMFGLGGSNAKVYVKSAEGIKFSDVAGEDEAKENLTEIVNYLHDPAKYQDIGASMPKGVLLVGPPGTGKTMLAKAVAGEANVPFFSMSGSEFVEMFVGMGASKVRDLFRQAKEKAPCIVFIDEIDAIGKKRDGQVGGNDEREQTLNQLLTEMDGFEGNNGVIILAATNRPESLDPALTRPGRFDRRVPVELPDLKGREEILKVHARKIKVAEDVDYNKIARMASGASGAELANIVNEAALRAVRDGRRFATQSDLEESIEVVIAGYQKKNAILTDQEKWTVAYHEIGHALVAALQTHSAPVQKITIIPRTSGALGYTMQVEEGNHYLMTKEELENKIATLTGGRAAEEVRFGVISTGASNDIEQATKLARGMITRYGMSEAFDMVALETVTNQYLGGDASLAGDGLLFIEVLGQFVELGTVFREDADGLGVLFFHERDDLMVDLRLRFGRAGEGGVAAEVLVRDGLERDHVEIRAHAVARDHRAGELGRLLDVVGSARGDRAEADLLGGAAAGERRDLVLHFLACHQVMVALLDLHRVAQRARGAGDNGDLLHRGGVALQRRNERMTGLVVGDDPFFVVGEDGVLLLIACDDDLNALLQIGLGGEPAARAHGAQRGFVDDVRKLRAGSAGGHAGDLVEIDVLRDLDLPRVDLQNFLAALEVGKLDRHAAVKAARARERGIEGFGTVGGGEDDDAVVALKAVHFGQKLVERLLALVVAAVLAAAALLADGVDLVDEDDAGRLFLGLLEEVAHLARAHADEHLHEL